jgi:peptide/nickel transport system ATP-binding protein
VTVTESATSPAPPAGDGPYLVVEELSVRFPTADGLVQAVTDLSFDVELGKTLGIVGESGSGKSVSSMSVMSLHDNKRAQTSGSIRVDGDEIIGISEGRMRKIRGNRVAMIFQDPLSALHPFYKVGRQIAEAYLVHHSKATRREARTKAIDMLDRVGIPQPDRRVDDFPHQFSGGMRQRAMIAMALVNDPRLLIADEPTTALDVTVQAQILDLLQDLQRDFGSAIIFITHDIGVIAEVADDVLVMYAGRCVERGTCKEILTHPEMPYTWGLMSSVPDIAGDTSGRLHPIPGTPPSMLAPPSGCSFHPRCTFTDRVPGDLCNTQVPDLRPGGRGLEHVKRCHIADVDAVFEAAVKPNLGLE